jgi:alpha-tubulin suppressor-like RCC1 family protein
MSRAAKIFTFVFAIVMISVILIWFSGCSTGMYENNKGFGEFVVRIKMPTRYLMTMSRIIPDGTTHIRITLTGENGYSHKEAVATSESIIKSISNVPTGLHEALFEAILVTGENDPLTTGTVLAQRKHGFFMPAGETVNAGSIDLGIAIINNFAHPQTITVPKDTTLCIENWDAVDDHIVKLSSTIGGPAVYTIGGAGGIPNVTEAVQPDQPCCYHSASQLLDTAGTYYFMDGFGGDAAGNYYIEVVAGGGGGGTGTVSGKVTAGITTVPIAGVKVTVGGITGYTDANGDYSINGVAEGSQTITAATPGFVPYSGTVSVVGGETVTHNIALNCFIAVGAGFNYSIGLDSDGNVWGWGNRQRIAQGDSGTGTIYTPVQIKADASNYFTGVTNISVGYRHSLAIKSDGTAWAWGYGGDGQIGDGNKFSRYYPVEVKTDASTTLTNVRQVSAGTNLSFAVLNNGDMYGWGPNKYAETGYGSTAGVNDVKLYATRCHANLSNIEYASAGYYHGLAVASDGEVWAWGYGTSYRLGQGSDTNDKHVPVKVKIDASNNLSDVRMVVASWAHSLAITNNDTLYGWGLGTSGQYGTSSSQSYATSVLSGVASAASTYYHTLAFKINGEAWASGLNTYGQVGNGNTGTNATSFVQVWNVGSTDGSEKLTGVIGGAAGYSHSLAFRPGGAVMAWGRDDVAQLGDGEPIADKDVPVYTLFIPIPTGTVSGNVTDAATSLPVVGAIVTAGGVSDTTDANGDYEINNAPAGSQTITATADGYAQYSSTVEVVAGSTVTHNIAMNELSGLGTVTGVVTDAATSLPITGATVTVDGKSDTTNGSGEYSISGVTPGSQTITATASGYPNYSGTVDVIADSTVTFNIFMNTGTVSGTVTDSSTSDFIVGAVVTVDGKSDTTNGSGEYSISGVTPGSQTITATASGYAPYSGIVSVVGGSTVTHNFTMDEGIIDLSGGGNHTVALKSDGTVWAWGYNAATQCGQGTGDLTAKETPVRVKYDASTYFDTQVEVVQISAGWDHSLALGADGSVWAWGSNTSGCLGNGSASTTGYAIEILSSGAKYVYAGYRMSLVVKTDGTMLSWGLNDQGQLGVGYKSSGPDHITTPQVVVGEGGTGTLSGIDKASASIVHSLALTTGGEVYAWGYGINGILGQGSGDTNSYYYPVKVKNEAGTGNLTGIRMISGGNTNTAVVTDNDRLLTWGNNMHGQLGTGDTSSRYLPVEVMTNVSVASAGKQEYVVVVKTDETVWTCGRNDYGQLGNGTTTDSSTANPDFVQVLGEGGTGNLTGVIYCSAGGLHCTTYKPNASVWSWGRNTYGQMGIGNTDTPKTSPVCTDITL